MLNGRSRLTGARPLSAVRPGLSLGTAVKIQCQRAHYRHWILSHRSLALGVFQLQRLLSRQAYKFVKKDHRSTHDSCITRPLSQSRHLPRHGSSFLTITEATRYELSSDSQLDRNDEPRV